MHLAWIKITSFAAVLAAPLVSLAVLGPVPPYGNVKELASFPTQQDLVTGKAGAFDALGEAVLQRSEARKSAIILKNELGFASGLLDTKDVVSGRDGWLFYKHELAPRCLKEMDLRRALIQLDVLQDVAEASGVQFVVSMSPDKSMIYPEFLDPLTRTYWRCKPHTVVSMRKLIALHAPRILDHAMALVAAKAVRPDIPLYFKTDTHWTPYGGSVAVRALLARVYPDAPRPPLPEASNALETRPTDMGNVMLMLPKRESFRPLETDDEDALARWNTDAPGFKTVILHDSFYGVAEQSLHKAFPVAELYHLTHDADHYGDAVLSANRLIVNSVERILHFRAIFSDLSPTGTLAKALVAKNMREAGKCGNFHAAEMRPVALEGTEVTRVALRVSAPGQPQSTRVTVRPPSQPTGKACLRVAYRASKAATLGLALPVRGIADRFEPARQVPLPIAAGDETLTFVLPAYTAGKQVEVHQEPSTGPALEIRSVEIGELMPAR